MPAPHLFWEHFCPSLHWHLPVGQPEPSLEWISLCSRHPPSTIQDLNGEHAHTHARLVVFAVVAKHVQRQLRVDLCEESQVEDCSTGR